MENINIDHYICNYLDFCKYQKALDPKTIKAYRIDLSQYSEFIKASDYNCDKNLLQTYIAKMYHDYNVRTIKRKIASLKAFYNYLEYEEIIDHNPFSKLRIKLHEPTTLPRTVPLPTIDMLFQCAYKHKRSINPTRYQYLAAIRDIAVLELLFSTGMRVSELCFLRPNMVNLEERKIMIYGKGSKERMIQIANDDVFSAVSEYYNAFYTSIIETGFFFVNRLGHQLSDQSVRLMIRKYANAAGVNLHITPHMFRHSFATFLLEEDVDIRYIQALIGHSSITTTQIYTHITAKKQRDILATKHPRNQIDV